MSQPHTFTLKALRRPLSRKVETGTGFHTVPDGEEMADIEITIDVEKLARRLGVRAMKNKTGRATIAWGLVRVKALAKARVAQ